MALSGTTEQFLLSAFWYYLKRRRDGVTQLDAKRFSVKFYSEIAGIHRMKKPEREAALEELEALECIRRTASGGFLLTPKALLYLDVTYGTDTRAILEEIVEFITE